MALLEVDSLAPVALFHPIKMAEKGGINKGPMSRQN